MAHAPKVTWKQVGARIDSRFRELRLSKAELIRLSGVSDKTLNGYIDGEPIVRVDKRRRLATALGWTPDSIDLILEGNEPIEVSSETEARDELLQAVRDLTAVVEELARRLPPAPPAA